MDLEKIEKGVADLSDRFLQLPRPTAEALKEVLFARRTREGVAKFFNALFERGHRTHYGTTREEEYSTDKSNLRNNNVTDDFLTEIIRGKLRDSDWNDSCFVKKEDLEAITRSRTHDYNEDNTRDSGFKAPKVSQTDVETGFVALKSDTIWRHYSEQKFKVAFRPLPAVPFPVLMGKIVSDIDFGKGKVRVPWGWFSRNVDLHSVEEKHWGNLKETADDRKNGLRYVVARHFAGEVDSLTGRLAKVVEIQGEIKNKFSGGDVLERERTLASEHLSAVLGDVLKTSVFHRNAVSLSRAFETDMTDLQKGIAYANEEAERARQQAKIDADLSHLGMVNPINDWPVKKRLEKVRDSARLIGSELLGV